MAKQLVNIGTIPDDGTGDQLVTAFTKLNADLDEIYGGTATVVRSTAPASLIGAAGDLAGMIAFDATSVYVCISDYIDGGSNIWAQYTRDHTLLSNIGTNTHAQIDSHITTADAHIADATIHYDQASISITESQISDLQSYVVEDPTVPPTLLGEVGDVKGVLAVDSTGLYVSFNPYDGVSDIWWKFDNDHTSLSNIGTNTHAQIDSHITTADAHIADATIHYDQASISITESQISDLQSYAKFVTTPPTTSIGVAGDDDGLIAWDNTYFYVCTQAYDGATNIWKRIALAVDTW